MGKQPRTDLNKLREQVNTLTRFCNFLATVPEVNRWLEEKRKGRFNVGAAQETDPKATEKAPD